jgi:hypothetical protein
MTNETKKRFSFRKGKLYSGMARLPPSYEFRYGGEKLATIQCHNRFELENEWFWYGDGVNTASERLSLSDCKNLVLMHFKTKLGI